MGPELERRAFIAGCALGTLSAVAPANAAEESQSSRLGLVTYCQRIRAEHLRRRNAANQLFEPFTFLEHCRQLGAGGMQINLGVLDSKQAAFLREQAARHGMFIEAIISVPKKENELDRFTAAMRTAADVGVAAVRTTIIPGRRYEYFDSLEQFREYEARGRRALELAAPVAEKLKLPLAVENHKDHRNAERVALFEHIGSEFVGACVDTGNSMALLEDPIETVRALAPWAHSVHLKDQAVQAYDDGFLLADIPLGQGCLDLKQMVAILRDAKPDVQFSLELISRDPLKVPMYTSKFWATFPDLPAKDLARTLRMVRDRSTKELQYLSKMTDQEKLACEDANVRDSLDYARAELDL